jgi:uridine kinase
MDKRKRLLTELAQRLVVVSPDRTIRVAIDGVDGAGKTTFADELASYVSASGRPVIRASVDGFHNPRAVRYQRGKQSPEGYFEDSYNYAALKKYLLDPLSPRSCKRYRQAFFDHVTDDTVPVVEIEAPPSSVLLIDGQKRGWEAARHPTGGLSGVIAVASFRHHEPFSCFSPVGPREMKEIAVLT